MLDSSIYNTTALGEHLGYENLNSIGVEFDTYNNGATMDEDNGNHVGININGNINSIVKSQISETFEDGLEHIININFDNGHFIINMDNENILDYTISDYIKYSGYFGFSASTGGTMNVQYIDDIKLSVKQNCILQTTFAKNPNTGSLVKFASMCDVPENWITENIDLNQSLPDSWTSEKVNALPTGWTLNGTANDISDLSIFEETDIVWISKDGIWEAHITDENLKYLTDSNSVPKIGIIPKDSGFWIRK